MSNINSSQRFAHMLALAGIIHFFLLLSLHWQPPELLSLNKTMATLLETSLPETAVDIALQNFDSSEITAVTPPATATESITASLLATEPPLPRKRTVSATSHQSKDAPYLARWQIYVEDYGNTHYPEIALRNNLKGHLRLLVAIKKDGSLHEVSIRQSSGSKALDEAAIALVLAAAPFEPLPPEIATEVEILEIIRTWQFIGKLTTLN